MPHPNPERRTNAPTRPERLLAGLTPERAQAVTHGTGPLLLIAGPGAGETRALTHRIAYLLESEQARPDQILAVTFSVRAAGERANLPACTHADAALLLRRPSPPGAIGFPGDDRWRRGRFLLKGIVRRGALTSHVSVVEVAQGRFWNPLSANGGVLPSGVRGRFALEMGAASAAALLGVVTLVWPRWVEFGFGVDPDGGDGMFEWLVVGALFSLSLVCSLLAWRDRRASVT